VNYSRQIGAKTVTMPLLKYFGGGGKLCCRGAVRRELVLFRADCPFAAFRRPAEPDVFDTTRWRFLPAENAQAESEPQGQKPSQKSIAVEWHDTVRNRTLRQSARPPSSV
jgi:hypothetical protein